MGEYQVELSNPAWLELDAISDFHLHEVGPESAKKITDRILAVLGQLEVFPLSCTLVPHSELAEKGYRMLVCGEYVCISEVVAKTVYVHHIVTAATNSPALFD